MIVDGVDVGNWRREVKGRTVEVALMLAPGVSDQQRRLAQDAAARLARFLGRQLVLVGHDLS